MFGSVLNQASGSRRIKLLLLATIGFGASLLTCPQWLASAQAQTDNSPFPSLQSQETKAGPPLTNQEFVRLLYALPAHPESKDRLIEEIRKRGIDFPLSPGLRSLVATKSGNDETLRHTLEEADHRHSNPAAATAKLPPAREAAELLEQTKIATLGAAKTMPDYLVKQQIIRSRALGATRNWSVADHLTIAVSYRESSGEDYKLLSINGMPPGEDQSYGKKLGGTTSTGEFVTVLSELFKPETRAEFNAIDTDTVRNRPTIVYEYSVQKQFSHQELRFGERDAADQETIAGYRGRIWVDRENSRILRIEEISTEIDPGFPITAASDVIDYDWVTINEQSHLLPSRAVVELTSRYHGQTEQTRNEILFRGYRKFGTEVKITDINEKDFPPDKPDRSDKSDKEDKPEPYDPNKPPPAPELKPKPPKRP